METFPTDADTTLDRPSLNPADVARISRPTEMRFADNREHAVLRDHPPLATSHSSGMAACAVRDFDELKERIHRKIFEKIRPEELNKIAEPKRRVEVRTVIEHLLDSEAPLLNLIQRRQVLADLIDEVFGLGPLEKILRDSTLNDILINGPREVFVERRGRLEPYDVHFRDDDHLLEIIRRIVGRLGRRVDESSPMVDARLADGSRVNAIIAPLAVKGPVLSIRRFPANPLKLKELLAFKTLTPEMAQFLEAAIKAKINILVCGGTGSGKTTMLNWLSGFIPNEQRIVTIEDAAELRLQQRHVVQLESRPPNIEGKGEVTIRDLLRNALRMRPDRIVVGECRGAETLDMLQAMNTGHEGSLTTLHANSPRDALSRLEMMIMMAGIDLPVKVIRQQIASAIHLIVQMDRLPGGARRITSITELVGMEESTITLQDIYVFRQTGLDPTGKALGQFEATGIRPFFNPKIKAAGIDLAPALFQHRVMLRV